MSFLEVKQVSKTYKSGGKFHSREIQAVKDVSFTMEKGECLAIVGESGSGKSTLGRMVVGLEPITDGEILFQGSKVWSKHMSKERRQALQMVYQNSFEATNPKFTAAQIVEEPLRYFRLVPPEKRREREQELLARMGIPESEMDKKAASFSGGQLQRICIARALAAAPELILLDEPLSSLDVSVQAQILNLLQDIKEEYQLTYLLISHDLEVVYYLSDRLIVMYFGKVVEQIDDISLFEELSHPYSLDLIDAATYHEMDTHHGEDVLPTKGCIYASRCKRACERCRTEEPMLREIRPKHKIACHFGVEDEKE